MLIHVTGGIPVSFKAKRYATLDPVHHTAPSVEYVQKLLRGGKSIEASLLGGQDQKFSVLELKHGFSAKKDHGFRRHPHNCIYLFIEGSRREIHPITGLAKGYAGDGATGALTIDVYLDLLNIPVERRLFSHEMIERMDGCTRVYEAPALAKPHFTLEHLARAKHRASEANLYLTNNGFDKLYVGMPTREVLEAVDFTRFGRFR